MQETYLRNDSAVSELSVMSEHSAVGERCTCWWEVAQARRSSDIPRQGTRFNNVAQAIEHPL
jgi:hypothetical protein